MSVKYEILELDEGHYIKMLKCFSPSNSKESDSAKKDGLIVLFPGNPGIVEFYEYFALQLNQVTGLPVVALSFTGHLYDPTGLVKSWQPRTLAEQVSDRLKYIETRLLSDEDVEACVNTDSARLIFVGHSIGCYTILEVLDQMNDVLRERVAHAFLLMPTIEHMRETPNGRRLTFASRYLSWLFYFLTFVVTFLLPDSMREFLVDRVTNFDFRTDTNLIDELRDIVLNMSSSFSCLRSCFLMGGDEMQHVREANLKSIVKNANKLTFYYGTKDKWCPYKYYVRMRQFVDEELLTANAKQPSGNDTNNNSDKINAAAAPTLIIDENDIEHAFVVFKSQCEFFVDLIAQKAKPLTSS